VPGVGTRSVEARGRRLVRGHHTGCRREKLLYCCKGEGEVSMAAGRGVAFNLDAVARYVDRVGVDRVTVEMVFFATAAAATGS